MTAAALVRVGVASWRHHDNADLEVCEQARRRARSMPDRTANHGVSRSLTDNRTPHPTCFYAAHRTSTRSLPSWSCGFDSRHPLSYKRPGRKLFPKPGLLYAYGANGPRLRTSRRTARPAVRVRLGAKHSGPPAGGVAETVRAVLVPDAPRQTRFPPRGVAPCHRVGRRQAVAVQVQPARLDPEPVKLKAAPRGRAHDHRDFGRRLASAHRPSPTRGRGARFTPADSYSATQRR